MEKLQGLIAAPFTPFRSNGEIDLSRIPSLSRLYHHNGVSGVFICGTTGEGPSLSLSEKRAMMQSWNEAKGKLKAIFMLGGNCLQDQVELARYAQDCGMDALAVLPPYFFKPDNVSQLINHCKLVAAACADLPFYYYHIPALTGVNLPMKSFLLEAEKEIPNLAGIKYSHSTIPDFHSCLQHRQATFNLLWGTDEALLSALAVGAQGAVGSTYNYAAPLYHQIMEAFHDGDLVQARKWQDKSVQMVELLVKYGGISAGKAFMKIIGADCGPCRSPLISISDREVLQLEKELKEIGFFEFCSQPQ